jgi:mRNA interferase MazF
VIPSYVPETGDLIWLDFTPQVGREHAGRGPAVVLSPSVYNRRSRLATVCPVTNQVKGYPFEVPLPKTLPIPGVVLADHLGSLDLAGASRGKMRPGIQAGNGGNPRTHRASAWACWLTKRMDHQVVAQF